MIVNPITGVGSVFGQPIAPTPPVTTTSTAISFTPYSNVTSAGIPLSADDVHIASPHHRGVCPRTLLPVVARRRSLGPGGVAAEELGVNDKPNVITDGGSSTGAAVLFEYGGKVTLRRSARVKHGRTLADVFLPDGTNVNPRTGEGWLVLVVSEICARGHGTG